MTNKERYKMNDWIIWETNGAFYDAIMNGADWTVLANCDCDELVDYIFAQMGI